MDYQKAYNAFERGKMAAIAVCGFLFPIRPKVSAGRRTNHWENEQEQVLHRDRPFYPQSRAESAPVARGLKGWRLFRLPATRIPERLVKMFEMTEFLRIRI